MNTGSGQEPIGRPIGRVAVGVWSVERLRDELRGRGVLVNEYADVLLGRSEMHLSAPCTLDLVAVTVHDLGLPLGGTMPEVFSAAIGRGLHLCPLATGPYLRLRHEEPESNDPVLRRHRPPEGALHVASGPLSADGNVPRGFYLRTVEGHRWLRGYRCDDDYVVPATTTYTFSRGRRQSLAGPRSI